MGQHLAYTQKLFDRGKIVLGGAATDGAIGVIVWRVDSAEEMQRIYESDPAVKAGQRVITSGPYAQVRHPMYLGFLVMFLSTPPALDSLWALPVFLLLPVFLVFRIRNEEEVLARDLPGYAEYSQKVRYRLIPLVW